MYLINDLIQFQLIVNGPIGTYLKGVPKHVVEDIKPQNEDIASNPKMGGNLALENQLDLKIVILKIAPQVILVTLNQLDYFYLKVKCATEIHWRQKLAHIGIVY